MLPHIDIRKQFPAAYIAYIAYGALERQASEAVDVAVLSSALAELVRLRVSQLNGYAFCLRLRTRDAIAAGESSNRLAVLPAWYGTEFFTDKERAALRLAEQITDINGTHALTAPEVDIAAALSDEQISAVTWLAVAINGWNRIAIASHYPHRAVDVSVSWPGFEQNARSRVT